MIVWKQQALPQLLINHVIMRVNNPYIYSHSVFTQPFCFSEFHLITSILPYSNILFSVFKLFKPIVALHSDDHSIPKAPFFFGY